MKKRTGPSKIGFISDIHCGSKVGLWPLDRLSGDAEYKGIRYLMSCFEDMVNSWPKLDLLVLMGDLIDGKQKKSDGVGLLTTDLGEQADAAATVLEKAASKADVVYRVWGTPYHETHDSILKIVDRALGVNKSDEDQVIDLETGYGVLNLAHHPSSGQALYQGTVVDRESMWSEIASYEDKTNDVRFIIRGHKHTYFLQETAKRTICLLPCFQLPTAYAVKQNYWRFQPSLGGVLMVADDDLPSGYKFIPYLYPVPKKEIKKWSSPSRSRR